MQVRKPCNHAMGYATSHTIAQGCGAGVSVHSPRHLPLPLARVWRRVAVRQCRGRHHLRQTRCWASAAIENRPPAPPFDYIVVATHHPSQADRRAS